MGKYDGVGEKDPRCKDKPRKNPGNLPVMVYDYKELPFISENIWHAQMTGWPVILTYDYVADKTGRRKNRSYKRYHSITKEGVVKSRESSADEYPFASTVENAGSVFIGHAPEKEQQRQGGIIRSFYREHGAEKFAAENRRSFWFEVRVINYPNEIVDRENLPR